MKDERLRALYAAALAKRGGTDQGDPVLPEAMVALLERQGTEAERRETLRRILRDPALREDFELLRALVRAEKAERPWWRSRATWQLAAGIVVVTGLGLALSLQQAGTEPLRGGQGAVTLIQPADGGESAAPPTFVWQQVPGAVDYRLEVADSTGVVVFETRVADTTSAGLPESTLVAGRRYLWSVTVLTRDARTTRSVSRAFRLRAP